MNSVYTVHNSKYCLPKSTNAGKKKKKKRKNVNWKMRTRSPNAHKGNSEVMKKIV